MQGKRKMDALLAMPTYCDSSVGMALAAMEALNNLNLFGEEVCGMEMYLSSMWYGNALTNMWYKASVGYEVLVSIVWYGHVIQYVVWECII